MSTRRSVLYGGFSLSVVGIAGCLDEIGSGIDEEDYDEAIDLLETNSEQLDEYSQADDLPETFDGAEIESRADEAEQLLEDLDPDSEENEELVENGFAIATYQRQMVELYDVWIDFEICIDDAVALMDAERFGDAQEELDSCRSYVTNLETELEEVEDAHHDIDSELLEAEGQIDHELIEDDIDEFETLLEIVDDLLDSFDEIIVGVEYFLDGADYIEQDRFGTAEVRFQDAADAFDEADWVLGGIEESEDLPREMRADMIELRCIADNMNDVAEDFASASGAMNRGDYFAAEDAMDDAERSMDALDRC